MKHPLLALLVLALAAAGCSPAKPPAKTAAAVPVLTAVAVAKNMPVQIDPPPVGHVLPIQTVTIRPQIGGSIRRIHFAEGQEVKAGDPLFTIDPRPSQAALELAQANLQRDTAQLKNAQIQYEREQKLYGQKLISQDEYDTSRATLDGLTGTVAADRAAITNATLNLEYTDIRSPIDGVTGSLQFHEGNVVKAPDDVLLTVNQIQPIYVAFAVPEKYLPEIWRQSRNHPLTVAASYENLAATPPQGTVTFIDNTVDTTTGTIQLRATFPNGDRKLWPGQFVQLALQLDELTNAVVVPTQAVQAGQAGPSVFVVQPDQTVEQRRVTNGVTVLNEMVITCGLAAGERVVTDGQLRLTPGVKVDAKSQPDAAQP